MERIVFSEKREKEPLLLERWWDWDTILKEV
jgi:hypothetical protein